VKRELEILLLSLALLLLAGCDGEGIYSGTLILDGRHEVVAGETLPGDVLVLGGQTFLAAGARVTSSIYMLNGKLDVNGEIRGDVSLIGGELNLGPQARVIGNVDVGGGTLNRAPEAAIQGRLNSGSRLQMPSAPSSRGQDLAGRLFRSMLNALLVAVLAFILGRFVPRPVMRVTEAVTAHPVMSGAMGILAGIVGLSLLVLMAFTIILIPVTLLGIFLLGAAVVFGWIAWGVAVGRRLAQRFAWTFRRPGQAMLGTLAFVLAVELIGLIPYVGGIIGILTASVGLGAVLLTRFGVRRFVPASDVL
jgi:cytoskeletal protein CcmA (bactofilin family)